MVYFNTMKCIGNNASNRGEIMSDKKCPELQLLETLQFLNKGLIDRNPDFFKHDEYIWAQNVKILIENRIAQLTKAQTLEA